MSDGSGSLVVFYPLLSDGCLLGWDGRLERLAPVMGGRRGSVHDGERVARRQGTQLADRQVHHTGVHVMDGGVVELQLVGYKVGTGIEYDDRLGNCCAVFSGGCGRLAERLVEIGQPVVVGYRTGREGLICLGAGSAW